jgi:hypothetical protein
VSGLDIPRLIPVRDGDRPFAVRANRVEFNAPCDAALDDLRTKLRREHDRRAVLARAAVAIAVIALVALVVGAHYQ